MRNRNRSPRLSIRNRVRNIRSNTRTTARRSFRPTACITGSDLQSQVASGHGRFLREPEFESEERVATAVLEFDKVAADAAGSGDRAHGAEGAEIVLGNRPND